MEPSTTAIITFTALEIAKYHIKQLWGGKVLPFLFPKKTYQVKLEQLLTDTIIEFRKKYPKDSGETRIQFFEDKDAMAKLSMLVLFKEGTSDVLVSDFEAKDNVIAPTQEEIEFFYKYFVEKARSDKKLRKLHIDEQYREEIFRISQSLEKLTDKVKEINNDTKSIKTDTSKLLEESQVIQEGIKAITEKFDASVKVTYQLALSKTEVHPLAKHVTKRIATVNMLNEIFDSKSWLAIVGSISTGKTQLSVIIAERYTSQKHWIGLRQFDANNYFLKIVYGLAGSLGIQPNPNIEQLVNEIGNSLSEGDLIILDDVPKLDGRTKADELFVSFINMCIQKKVKLLSTSNYEIPISIKQLLPEDEIEFANIPFFTEDEVNEVLIAFGANDETAASLKVFVRALSSGHPTIVTAIGRFLASKDWQFTQDELGKLFSGDYSTELNDATYENILRTINQENTRELLYRINLITGNFSEKEVTDICAVKPAIKLPLEKFHSVIGLWVQKTGSNKYELSPLIKRLKSSNLDTDLKHGIYLVLGKAILDRKRLDQFEANKAISYFISAQAYNDAGFVLTLVLNESLKQPELFFDWGFNLFWYKQELPKEMDIFLRMYIRIMQLMLGRQKGEDLTFLKNDLERIVEIASKKGVNIGSAALLLSSLYATEDSGKANHYFILGVRSYNELKELAPIEKELSEDFSPEGMVWSSTISIKTKAEIENWFEVYEQLTPEQRKTALDSEIIDLGSMIVGKNLITEEERKDAQNQDWNSLLVTLEYIQNKALELGLDLMAANAMRYIINVHSEKLNSIEDAQRVANELMLKLPDSPTAQFLFKDAIGRQLFYHGKNEDAMPFVADAVAIEVDDFYTEKLDTYLVISQLLGDRDENTAHYYSEQALEFATDNQYFSEALQAKVIGEYGISLGLNGKIEDAIRAFARGYQVLLNTYESSPEYKHLVLWFGHIANYWCNMLTKGVPPEKDMSGGGYTPPARGMLLRTYNHEKVENIFFEGRRFIVAYLFLNCFEELGDLEESKKWAYNILSINSDLDFNTFSLVIHSATTYLIVDQKYNEAINSQVKVIETTNILSDNPEKLEAVATNEVLKHIFKDRPKTKIDQIDEIVFERVIVPVILQVLSQVIEQPEKKHEIFDHLQDVLKRWTNSFSNTESMEKVMELLDAMGKGAESKKILEDVSSYKGELESSVKVIGYLFASFNTPTIEALRLHLALMARLETVTKKLSLGTYKFILTPFVEKFWLNRYEEKKEDFSDPLFWVQKSFPYYRKANWEEKIKRLFEILCHHLNYEPTVSESNWLDN